jgi:hypothetical protein
VDCFWDYLTLPRLITIVDPDPVDRFCPAVLESILVLDTRRDVTVIIDRTIPAPRTDSVTIVQGSVLTSVPDIDHTGITQEVVTATTVIEDLVLGLAADRRGFRTSSFLVGVRHGLDETEWVSNSPTLWRA